jgi:ATPase subunit of ABC transporter with duplicated ATPase domains
LEQRPTLLTTGKVVTRDQNVANGVEFTSMTDAEPRGCSSHALDVPTGAIYALVGPNGAGKTTSIKILMNIFPATCGRAEVLATDSSELAGQSFTSIGYLSENQEHSAPTSETCSASKAAGRIKTLASGFVRNCRDFQLSGEGSPTKPGVDGKYDF